MDTVTVKIKFFGTIASLSGLKEFSAPVRREREKGLEDINRIVREKAGNQVLYTILINGVQPLPDQKAGAGSRKMRSASFPLFWAAELCTIR